MIFPFLTELMNLKADLVEARLRFRESRRSQHQRSSLIPMQDVRSLSDALSTRAKTTRLLVTKIDHLARVSGRVLINEHQRMSAPPLRADMLSVEMMSAKCQKQTSPLDHCPSRISGDVGPLSYCFSRVRLKLGLGILALSAPYQRQ
jgi:hypothetical protein